MIPPTKMELQALAGWAITARGNCSDQQHMALCHFQDGCGELAEVIDDLHPLAVPTPQPPPSQKEQVIRSSAPIHPVRIPEEVQDYLGIAQGGECVHRFDIRTQLCVYCGLSYLKAHGRKPELF